MIFEERAPDGDERGLHIALIARIAVDPRARLLERCPGSSE